MSCVDGQFDGRSSFRVELDSENPSQWSPVFWVNEEAWG